MTSMSGKNDRSDRDGLRFIGVGIGFLAYSALGGYLGHLASEHWGWGDWSVPLGIVLGVAFGTWDLLRMTAAVDRMDKKDRDQK
jgi:hypothetical protein